MVVGVSIGNLAASGFGRMLCLGAEQSRARGPMWGRETGSRGSRGGEDEGLSDARGTMQGMLWKSRA